LHLSSPPDPPLPPLLPRCTGATAPDTLRIAVAHLNPVMGDIAGNLARARAARAEAARHGAELVLFTDLRLSAGRPRAAGVLAMSTG